MPTPSKKPNRVFRIKGRQLKCSETSPNATMTSKSGLPWRTELLSSTRCPSLSRSTAPHQPHLPARHPPHPHVPHQPLGPQQTTFTTSTNKIYSFTNPSLPRWLKVLSIFIRPQPSLVRLTKSMRTMMTRSRRGKSRSEVFKTSSVVRWMGRKASPSGMPFAPNSSRPCQLIIIIFIILFEKMNFYFYKKIKVWFVA